MHPHIGHPHNAMSGSIDNKEKEKVVIKQQGTRGACGKGFRRKFHAIVLHRFGAFSHVFVHGKSGHGNIGHGKLAGSMSDEYVCR